MGIDSEYTEILGIRVPVMTIPVKPGRNLAVIIEVAAMNNRQKKMGYNAAQELLSRPGDGHLRPAGGRSKEGLGLMSNTYRIIADLHTHTLASTHAYSSVTEMIRAAAEKGLYCHRPHRPCQDHARRAAGSGTSPPSTSCPSTTGG